MRVFLSLVFLAVLGAIFFLVFVSNEVEVMPGQVQGLMPGFDEQVPLVSPPPLEPEPPTSSPAVIAPQGYPDIERQPQLQSPPVAAKGIYVTAWSAGSTKTMNRLIALIERTELNAVVIDIKDFSGHVSYRTGIPEVEEFGAEGELRILRPNALIKKLHDAGIYVIARQTVFQDPILAKAHPEWALKNASTSETWADNKGLAWMDPAAEPVWDYNVAIAKDALSRGFDEINFDYIRFASDGDLSVIEYPFWDEITPRHTVIRNFFKYLRENLPNAKISADLFGLSTISAWDLGIGQIIEDAYEYFDYISPMVYPSHYAKTFLGYDNPAEYPYEIVKYSLDGALRRLITYNEELITSMSTAASSSESSVSGHRLSVKLRPWLQDFDLGAIYDADMVKSQIQALDDLFLGGSNEVYFGGWLLWDPSNRYTEEALKAE